MGVNIAIGLVVVLFIGALIMWYVRSNETYENLLPPEYLGPEPPREDIVEFAERIGFKGVSRPALSDPYFYSDLEPSLSMAADAFALVEALDLRVKEMVVSPTIFNMIEHWSIFDSGGDPLTLWGAEVIIDEELADDVMITVPDIDPQEIPEVDSDHVGIGYVLWGVEGGKKSSK